jgi:hypothetical protein
MRRRNQKGNATGVLTGEVVRRAVEPVCGVGTDLRNVLDRILV